jgi:drug/metabolite transporter (DMT)-like permease
MHYILIALTSRIFLKEKVGLWRWVGTFFIVIGIILLTYSNA